MKVALLTSGGIAPCLSASIGNLIGIYLKNNPKVEIIGYINGYKGLLLGNSIKIPKTIIKNISNFSSFGGTPLGNSRVKLTNVQDCIKKGYIKKSQNPLEVAANQLAKDGVDILHTIGGDDTNTTAADLSNYLKNNNYKLTVVGLPKTIDNDVHPIKQTLGAHTAAEQGAIFFENIVNENTTSDRQLIVHEIMGRNCGWLTAATAFEYRKRLENLKFIPEINLTKAKWDIHAVFIPEKEIDFKTECDRLKKIMDKNDCVNIFISEGAGLETIIKENKKSGHIMEKDAFGHVRLDDVNAGQWFANKLGSVLKANKVLVQKSGYFARSAKANKVDNDLIIKMCRHAFDSAKQEISGVIGHDEDHDNKLTCIEFSRIRGHKKFNINESWFVNMINDIHSI